MNIQRNIKRALLINPPTYSTKGAKDVNPYPPLGLAYLSATLRSIGVETKVLDCFNEGVDNRIEVSSGLERVGVDEDLILDVLDSFNPDFVGITHQFTRQTNLVLEVLKIVNEYDYQIITAVGGSHPSCVPEMIKNVDNLNFLVIGEGEQTLKEIVYGLRLGIPNRAIWKPRVIEDLDTLPLPDWETVELSKYFGSTMSHGYRKKGKFAPVQTSRGCSANCVFCTAHKVWGRRFRSRSVDSVVGELRWLKDRFGIEEIMFEDDNLTLNKKRAKSIFCVIIRERLDLVWDTPNGIAVWTLDEELIDLMKASGCYKLNFALESGSQSVLDNIMHKPVKLERAKELVRYAQKIGLDVGMFLVMGLPGETFSDMKKSFALACDLGIYYPHISIATPYPGSELYRLCREFGYSEEILPEDYHIRTANINTDDWKASSLKRFVNRNKHLLYLKGLVKSPLDFLGRMKRRLL